MFILSFRVQVLREKLVEVLFIFEKYNYGREGVE
jgi:hypothetical protein